MENGIAVKFTDEHKKIKLQGIIVGKSERKESWEPRGRYDVKLADGSIVAVHESRLTVIK